MNKSCKIYIQPLTSQLLCNVWKVGFLDKYYDDDDDDDDDDYNNSIINNNN